MAWQQDLKAPLPVVLPELLRVPYMAECPVPLVAMLDVETQAVAVMAETTVVEPLAVTPVVTVLTDSATGDLYRDATAQMTGVVAFHQINTAFLYHGVNRCTN